MARNGSMKAAIKAEPKPGIRVGELPIPRITPEEVLIRVKAVAICGSDVHIYEWTPGYEHLTEYLPVVLGHEFSGEVAEVGSQPRGPGPEVHVSTSQPGCACVCAGGTGLAGAPPTHRRLQRSR